MLNLFHLKYFLTLARCQHYTKASEELMITQPTLSYAISNIEKELGVRLFEKDGRNVVLTKDGRKFASDVETILDSLDASIEKVKLSGEGNGVLDIGFLRVVGTFFLPKLMRDFLNANIDKKITFNLFTDTGLTGDLIDGLKNKKYDVVFCSKFDNEPAVEFVPVFSQNLILVVNSKHPLAYRDTISLEETLDYTYINFAKKSGIRQITDKLFKKIGAYPKNVYCEIEEDIVIAGLVSEGFGIAILPDMEILDLMNIKKIQITYPTWERLIYMAYLKDSYMTQVQKNFCDFAILNHCLREYYHPERS